MCPAHIGPGQPPWGRGSTHTSHTQGMHTAGSHEGGPPRRALAGVETGPFRHLPGVLEQRKIRETRYEISQDNQPCPCYYVRI